MKLFFKIWQSRSINPQVLVLTTVPRAAWHQKVVSHTVFLGNQVTSQSIRILLLHAWLSKGAPCTSLVTEGKLSKEGMRRALRRILDRILGEEATVKSMEAFCWTKKRMFLPIRGGIDRVLFQLEGLCSNTEWAKGWALSLEYHHNPRRGLLRTCRNGLECLMWAW